MNIVTLSTSKTCGYAKANTSHVEQPLDWHIWHCKLYRVFTVSTTLNEAGFEVDGIPLEQKSLIERIV